MKRTIAVLLFTLLTLTANAQSADVMQKRLEAEAVKLKAWTADKIFIAATRAQNDQHLKMAEIVRRDQAWMAGKAGPLVRQITTGQCADHLRQLTSQSPMYGETFVMDNQGALVCASEKTSDYWQGDEAKWTKSFNEGKGAVFEGKGAVFIDRPRLDESAHERLAQISLPIYDGGKVIGAMTIGIDITKIK